MKNNVKKFIDDAHRIRLSDEEKRAVRDRLSTALMLGRASVARAHGTAWRGATFALALVFVAVGAYAMAERALPGDALYGMKLRVNEGVREALATSDEDELLWGIGQLERRLAETERIAVNEGY